MAVLLSSGFEILPFSDVAFVEITAESGVVLCLL